MDRIQRYITPALGAWFISGFMLVIFLVATDPLALSLPVLLLPFGLFFIWVRNGIVGWRGVMHPQAPPGRKTRVVANSIAAILLLAITLQSLGQFSWRDLLLIAILSVALSLYIYRTDLV